MMKSKKSKKMEGTPRALEELIETLITPEDRLNMISEAAYYRAEQRGFNPEGVDQDWYEAENMIDSMLMKEAEKVVEHA